MRTQFQKLLVTAVLSFTLVSPGLPVWAGSVGLPEVTTTDPVFGTLGTMAGTRYSTDSVQYIGCSFSNTTGPFVTCSATDKTGKSSLCTSTSPAVATAAKAITDFSYIQYNVAPDGRSCKNLTVENSSENLR